MRSGIALLMALLLVAGCSDDDKQKSDGAVVDQGVVTDSTVTGDLGTQQDTGPAADGAEPQADGAEPQADSSASQDAMDPAVVCAAVIANCAGTEFEQWIDPFTEASCQTMIACVMGLYTGDCQTKYSDYTACLTTISATVECETKCADLESDLQQNCECPASCGVNCGGP